MNITKSTTNDEFKLLKVEEVANFLRISPRSIYNKVSNGDFPIKVRRCGRLLRFDSRDVKKYAEEM